MNLFTLAENQLIKEKENGNRKNYKLIDIIDYAIAIRVYLDLQEEKREKNLFKKVI